MGVEIFSSSMNKKTYLFSISSHPNAISVNSLDIKLLKPKIDFHKYDYFIITSKQVSKALKQYGENELILKNALCISSQTAKSYEELGGYVLELGSGYGDGLVDKIKAYSKDVKWLYLRAETIASDFVSICKKDGYKIDEVIMYESACSKDILEIEVEDNATLIFTSPSSVKCFLKKHTISKDNSIVVIGLSTAKAIPKDISFHVAKENTIESCFDV